MGYIRALTVAGLLATAAWTATKKDDDGGACCGTGKPFDKNGVGWPSWSYDDASSGYSKDSDIDEHNIGQLTPTWTYVTQADQKTSLNFPSLRGALSTNGILYWALGSGPIIAFNEKTGAPLWVFDTTRELGRATAKVKGGLYLNEEQNELVAGTHDQGAAVLFAINARAGTLKWKTKVLDLDPTSWITAEPAYSKTVDMYFIGMSSFETTLASTPGYVGFQFVGKVFAVHRCNATQAWVQYMSPPSLIPGQKPQFPGASVWGALTILNDDKKGDGHVDMEVNGGKVTVIVPTGQNYQVPDPLYQCRQNVTAECGGNNTCIVEGRMVCRGLYDSPDNLMESIVSLDGGNGTRIWAYRTGDDAPWNSACVTSTTNPNCQRMDIGVDGDLSDPPMAMTIEDGQGKKIPILVGLQKSGMVHVIRQSDGSMVHANALAPQGGSSLAPGGGYGGFMWGGCNDGKYVYASHTNFASKNYTFIDGTTYNGASVIAYDPATNSKVWETKDPMNGLLPTGLPPIPTNFQSWAMMPGPTACAPGVVGATSTSGHLYGLSAKTGAILLDVQLRAGSLGSGLMFGKDAAYCSSGFRSGLYSVNKSEPFIIARLGLPEQP